MGLGGLSAVSLADARKARDEAERLVREGRDPIAARVQAREERATKPTFGEAAVALIAAKGAQWRNEKHRGQWKITLETYAASIRSTPVDEIGTEDVLGVLQPISTLLSTSPNRCVSDSLTERGSEADRCGGSLAFSTSMSG